MNLIKFRGISGKLLVNSLISKLFKDIIRYNLNSPIIIKRIPNIYIMLIFDYPEDHIHLSTILQLFYYKLPQNNVEDLYT